jgi:hypothetical protein
LRAVPDDSRLLGDAIGYTVAESICHAHIDAHGLACPDCESIPCSDCDALAKPDTYAIADTAPDSGAERY